MKPTLIALAFGFALGIPASFLSSSHVATYVDGAAAIGGWWAAGLRLIVMPLIVCLLITGLAGSSSRLVGRLGAICFAVFVAMLVVGTLLGLVLTPALVRLLGVPRGVLAVAMSSSQASNAAPGGAAIVQAMLNNQLLMVIAVTVLFALAMTRIAEEKRKTLVAFFDAAMATIVVILSWILRLMPAAVFFLAFATAVRSGLSAARALISLVAIAILLLVLFTIAMYAVASIFGRVSLRQFASAALPVQIVAGGTRSSLASLPALLDAGDRLGLPASVNAFVMPLCVSIFKVNRTITGMVYLFFLAHVCGVELNVPTIVAYAATGIILSFASPGTPGAGVLTATAPLLAAGIPMAAIVMTQAMDDLPDVFKTIANVTADLAAGAVVARFAGAEEMTGADDATILVAEPDAA